MHFKITGFIKFEIMKQCEIERAISCLKLAIELAGDGGMTPFTDVEYELMTNFLNEAIELCTCKTNKI